MNIEETKPEIQELWEIAKAKGYTLMPTIRKDEIWLEKDNRIKVRLVFFGQFNFILRAGHVEMYNFYEDNFDTFKEKVKKLL